MTRLPRSLAPLAVAAIALAVSLPRVCPTVAVLGDSAVMTAAAITWGVPQPPGYPLFALLGHLASLVPLGDVAWRVNVTSALFHALTAGIVADTVGRTTRSSGVDRAARGADAPSVGGLAAGLFLVFTRRFFLGSLYAEVFPLNDLMTSAVFALGLAVLRQEKRGPKGDALLAAFVVVAALASAHHQMIALAAPGLAVLVGPYVLRVLRENPRRIAALAGVFAVVVALAYALVLVSASRDPAVSWGDVHDVRALVRLFLRADYGGPASATLVADEGHAVDRVVLFGSSTWGAFGALGVGLAALGLAAGWRDSRRLALGALLGWLACGPVFAAMNAIPVADAHGAAFLERFFTMSDVVLSLFVGLGVAEAERLSSRKVPRAVLLPALGAVWLVPLFSHRATCDLRDDRTGEALAHDLVRAVPEGAVVLIAGDDLVGAATYECAVTRACEGRAFFSPGQLHLGWRAEQIARRHPGIALTPRGGRPPRASEIVTDNLAAHPVLVAASLLDLDPTLRELPIGFLPQGVLVRVVDEAAIPQMRDAFVAESRGMLTGETCEGCKVGSSGARALEDRAIGIDVTALENHARVLRQLLGDPDDAAALDTRAAALGR